MRHLLNDCAAVWLCDETHYMGHLLPSACMRRHFRRFAPLTDDANVHRLVDHMYAPEFRHYSRFKELGWQWRWIVENFSAEQVGCRTAGLRPLRAGGLRRLHGSRSATATAA